MLGELNTPEFAFYSEDKYFTVKSFKLCQKHTNFKYRNCLVISTLSRANRTITIQARQPTKLQISFTFACAWFIVFSRHKVINQMKCPGPVFSQFELNYRI